MNQKKYYDQELTHEDSRVWHTILGYSLETANYVEFVVSKSITKWPPQLLSLLPFMTSVFTSRWRWEEKKRFGSVFVRFKLSAELRSYLQSVERLEEWVFLHPEDPALYLNDTPILWTISHDSLPFILLSNQEAQWLNEQGCNLEPVDDLSPPTSLAA